MQNVTWCVHVCLSYRLETYFVCSGIYIVSPPSEVKKKPFGRHLHTLALLPTPESNNKETKRRRRRQVQAAGMIIGRRRQLNEVILSTIAVVLNRNFHVSYGCVLVYFWAVHAKSHFLRKRHNRSLKMCQKWRLSSKRDLSLPSTSPLKV